MVLISVSFHSALCDDAALGYDGTLDRSLPGVPHVGHRLIGKAAEARRRRQDIDAADKEYGEADSTTRGASRPARITRAEVEHEPLRPSAAFGTSVRTLAVRSGIQKRSGNECDEVSELRGDSRGSAAARRRGCVRRHDLDAPLPARVADVARTRRDRALRRNPVRSIVRSRVSRRVERRRARRRRSDVDL
jgi:hypothetical protein